VIFSASNNLNSNLKHLVAVFPPYQAMVIWGKLVELAVTRVFIDDSRLLHKLKLLTLHVHKYLLS
jgi:hypothetical protein